VLDVLFAGPHHFDGPIDMLCDPHGSNDHVGFELASKPATEQMVVDDHLLDR
jgi:hypothetical protein